MFELPTAVTKLAVNAMLESKALFKMCTAGFNESFINLVRCIAMLAVDVATVRERHCAAAVRLTAAVNQTEPNL